MTRGGLDIFIGGGGDDLAWLGFGVVRAYARRYAAETGRPVIYSPNARVLRLVRRVRGRRPGAPLNIVGHSWGALDAYWLAVRLEGRRVAVDNLITLDPVGWPFGLRPRGTPAAAWLNVDCAPWRPDGSDRMTDRPPWSRKPSGLPTERAQANVVLDLNHWNVAAMMVLGGARQRLDESWARSQA